MLMGDFNLTREELATVGWPGSAGLVGNRDDDEPTVIAEGRRSTDHVFVSENMVDAASPATARHVEAFPHVGLVCTMTGTPRMIQCMALVQPRALSILCERPDIMGF